MVIGIVGGTGKLGIGLALRLARAGHAVRVGSRAVERAQQVVNSLAPTLARYDIPADSLTPASNASAASAAALVFLAAPAEVAEEAAAEVARELEGKTLVDCSVDFRKVGNPGFGGTAARIQERVGSEVRVVAGFHTIAAAKLADLSAEVDGDVLIVGDDGDAKRATLEVVRSTGMRAFDAGVLADGATLERVTVMLIGMNRRYRRSGIGLRLTGAG